jgi:PKD repeat protein
MKKIMFLFVSLIITTSAFAQAPEWQWATQAGSTGFDNGKEIAIDVYGNSIVTGSFTETANFGTYTLTSSGNSDIFVAKMDVNGNWLWATNAGGTDDDSGNGIAIDATGNIYVTGYFMDTSTFGSNSLSSFGGGDIFVAKIDLNGNWLWVTQAGGTGFEQGLEISTDNTGNSYIVGYFFGTASFGSNSLSSFGGSDIFVAKIDFNGNWLWATCAIVTQNGYGHSIAIDSAGNSFVTGRFSETATFGSNSLTSSGLEDIFIAKMDIDGNWLWATQAGGTSNDNGNSITIDTAGNSYITGFFKGTAIFGLHSLITNTYSEIFVAKVDTNGNWQWATQAGGTNQDHGFGITTDDFGKSYVTGYFRGTATFGSHTIMNSGEDDIFVAKINTSGNWQWAIKAGGNEDDSGLGIAIDYYGNSYIIGYFEGIVSFGSNTLSSSGDRDIFVARLESDFEVNFIANPTSGFAPLEVEFTDLSVGNAISWEWDFNYDGVIDSYLQNPVFTYSEIGVYSVSLSVSDGFNTDTKIEENYITADGPTADFIADITIGYAPLNVSFTSESLGNIITWEWDFQNDGTIDSSEENPLWNYEESGLYSVSLTISDGINTDTETKVDYITVGEPIVAEFAAIPTEGLLPLDVQFTDLSTGGLPALMRESNNSKIVESDNSREIVSWEWDFNNDGIIDSYEQNPQWTYTEAGLYTVTLTVSDGSNTDTEIKIDYITVGEPIIADFEAVPLLGLAPLDVQFTDLSTGGIPALMRESNNSKIVKNDNSREIVSWEWDFNNDGTIDSYEQNPLFTYTEAGLYTVTLTVSDGSNTDTETKIDYISVLYPIADFEADSTFGYCPFEVQFTDLSTGSIISWEWDFNYDGVIDSYLQNPIYTYSEAGVYTVSLTVSDGIYEDTEIKEDYITVLEPLNADFEANVTSGDPPLEVQFTDLSTGNVSGWMWDFDNDGTIDSNEQNPIYVYDEVGVYTISLTVSDGISEDTEIKEDYITVISTGIHNGVIPLETLLYQNHPNPFNPVTNIQFDIKENETGILSIYNTKGQLIVSQQFVAGQHIFQYNASEQSSGVYLYNLKTNSFSKTNKMLLLK